MDILAHGLWVGLGAAAWHRRRPQDRRTIGLALAEPLLVAAVGLVVPRANRRVHPFGRFLSIPGFLSGDLLGV